MKRVSIAPIGAILDVRTDSRLAQDLLAASLKLPMACGGKGLCATCHVFVQSGMENLSEATPRELRSLSRLSGMREGCSRLACQCRVRGDVKVSLPDGLFIEQAADLESLIGRRAERDLLHPADGRVLVAAGKIITRFIIKQLENTDFRPWEGMEASREVGRAL